MLATSAAELVANGGSGLHLVCNCQWNSVTVQQCNIAAVHQQTNYRCTLHRSKGAQNFTLEAQCTIVLLLCETNWEHVHCAPFSHFSTDVIPANLMPFPPHFRRQSLTTLYLPLYLTFSCFEKPTLFVCFVIEDILI